MDRCVLLTSTPERVVSPRRAITRAQPDYNMMLAISVRINQCSAYQKQIKAWIESNRRRRCHVTTWSRWQVSLSPLPPIAKVHAPVFCGKQSLLIELHQSGVIAWRPWQHHRSCGVFKNWISVAHCPFQRKWRVLHIWYISVLEQVGMSFNGIAHLMKV